MDQCTGWASYNSDPADYEGEVARMICNLGKDVDERGFSFTGIVILKCILNSNIKMYTEFKY